MSRQFVVLGQLLSALGEGENAVSDNDLAKIAGSPELIEDLRVAVKDILAASRRARNDEISLQARLGNSKIGRLPELADSDIHIDDSIIAKLSENNIVTVRELIALTREDLHLLDFLPEEVIQLDVALQSVGLDFVKQPLPPDSSD